MQRTARAVVGTINNKQQRKSKMKTTKITGGRAGFCDAINEAFYHCHCMNPCIRYSQTSGFYIESDLIPADDDVVWSVSVCYWNGQRSVRPAQYADVRDEILETVNRQAERDLAADIADAA